MLRKIFYTLYGIALIRLGWDIVGLLSCNPIGNIFLWFMFVIAPGYIVGLIIEDVLSGDSWEE